MAKKKETAEVVTTELKSRGYGKITSLLSGNAGEYTVAAELSRRGYIASLTMKNSKGVDILVTDEDAKNTFAIQVKTNQGYQKYWMLTEKSETMASKNFFYILVNLGSETGLPEFHIVPSEVIVKEISKSHKDWLAAPGKKGQAHKDNKIRKFFDEEDRYLGKWELLR